MPEKPPLYKHIKTLIRLYTAPQEEWDEIEDDAIVEWNALSISDRAISDLASQTLNLPSYWRRTQSIRKGDTDAPHYDQIRELLREKDRFAAHVFWRIMGSQWRHSDLKHREMQDECRRREADAYDTHLAELEKEASNS